MDVVNWESIGRWFDKQDNAVNRWFNKHKDAAGRWITKQRENIERKWWGMGKEAPQGAHELGVPSNMAEGVPGNSSIFKPSGGGLGITTGDALRTAADFTPFVGSGLDIYEGIRDGDGWQVAMGAGFFILDIATLGSASLVKGSVKTGFKIGRKALTNPELVQKAANLAERAIGGTGRFAGTSKHNYATELLERYQGIYGNRGLDFRVPFNNGPGNRGFLDVLDNTNGKIYDWKFGYPGRTPTQLNKSRQLEKYRRNFGLPTEVIKPW